LRRFLDSTRTNPAASSLRMVRVANVAQLASLGLDEGRSAGRTDLLARLLAHRFGPLPAAVHERLASASIEELDAIGERLLTAQSLIEALG
jgi:hypothetical protein